MNSFKQTMLIFKKRKGKEAYQEQEQSLLRILRPILDVSVDGIVWVQLSFPHRAVHAELSRVQRPHGVVAATLFV